MHSIVGSYLKPPERVLVPSFTQNDQSAPTHHSVSLEVNLPKMLHSPNSQGNANINSYLKLGEWYEVCYIKLHLNIENNAIVYLTNLNKTTHFDSCFKFL